MKRIEAEGRLKEWCADNLDWLRKTYGTENLVSAVLHMDEATPHIHATVVPIVTGERRKVNEKKPGKKRYRKKSTAQPRLCADDVMTRVKLKAYQDSYAEAMSKYGLERGIVGSEARHVTTQEFYRNAIAQQQNLQDNINELLKIVVQKRQAVELFTQQEREAHYDYERTAARKELKTAELDKTEAVLKAVKGELKTERFKGVAAEAGSAIMDGISSVSGTSKVERQEQEIAELRGEIAEQKRENTSLKKEVDALKFTIDRITDESGKEVHGLRNEIAHLHDLMPELTGLLQVEKTCQTVGFNKELMQRILNRETVGFKGRLYSPEHHRWLTTDHSEAKIVQDPQEKWQLQLLVAGVSISLWLKLKHEEQYPRPQVKEPQRQNRGVGIKW